MRNQLGQFIKGNNGYPKNKLPKQIRKKISNTLFGKYRKQNNPNWKGGRYIDIATGYVRLLLKSGSDKYIYEHRFVMEKILKRKLKPKEVVHHINGVKNDNRLENLLLLSNEKKHREYHIDWNKKTRKKETVNV